MAASNPKPTIIYIPGAWHTPAAFQTVRTQLESLGYPTAGVYLASVGAEPPLQTWEKDVEAIHAAAKQPVDAGGDVIYVMHSYGGLPGSEAVKGLVKTEREKEGKRGGVLGLVYIASMCLGEGGSLAEMSEKRAEWIVPDVRVDLSPFPLAISRVS